MEHEHEQRGARLDACMSGAAGPRHLGRQI